MRLPSDSIGISDLLDWRECPQRMGYGMRRHATLPDGRKDEPPGHTNWTNAYGSAIHDAIHLVETEKLPNEQAVQRVWETYGGYLDPEERAMLLEDLESYRGDTPPGMELVVAEMDVRVPLFVHEGRQMYFRFKLDALYRRIADPTAFFHRDYKSSKHRRTKEEVDKDLQMWAYNWGIFELFPEARTLIQSYEQLRFGNIPTGKNAEQRAQMKAWLIDTVKTVLADEKMEPKQNEWCPYCPLVVTCDQTKRSSRYWKGRLNVLAPMVKEGRKTKVTFLEEGEDVEHMIELLPEMVQTRKHLEAAEKALKEIIAEMPSEERARVGWRLSDRKTRVLTPEGIRELHAAVGDSFYEMVSLARSAVEGVVGKPAKGEPPPPALELMKRLELEQVSSTTVLPTDR